MPGAPFAPSIIRAYKNTGGLHEGLVSFRLRVLEGLGQLLLPARKEPSRVVARPPLAEPARASRDCTWELALSCSSPEKRGQKPKRPGEKARQGPGHAQAELLRFGVCELLLALSSLPVLPDLPTPTRIF